MNFDLQMFYNFNLFTYILKKNELQNNVLLRLEILYSEDCGCFGL